MNLWDRFKEKSIKLGIVSSMEIEITNSCNLSCDHCYKIRSSQFISRELFTKALDEAAEIGVVKIGLNGGEPTLHPLFLDFALLALSRGFILSILTNGTLLDKKKIEALSPYKGIKIQVSFYGHDPDSGERITGDKNSWTNSINNCTLIKEAGFKLDTVIFARNDEVDYIPNFFKLLTSKGFDPYINPLMFPREDGDLYPLSLAITQDQYSKIAKLDKRSSSNLEKTSLLSKCDSDTQACGAGIASISVDLNGEIKPCLLINISLGNINKDSLKKVLESKILADFKEANKVPEMCQTCDYYTKCVRCPGACMFHTGEFTGILEENCRMAKLRCNF